MAQNINKKTKGRRAQGTQGSCLNAESNDFFRDFVCGDLANHPEVRHLVKLKEDRNGCFLRFNDVEKITSIYCDFKQANGKGLTRDLSKRKDNFKKIIKKQYEELGKLEKVAHGAERGKDYLKYEIKDSELWHSLTTKYSVQRKPDMQRHFPVMYGESSSDTGLGVSHSDGPSLPIETRGRFYRNVNELSSDTTGVSQSDDPSLPIEDVLEVLELLSDQFPNEQPNSGGIIESGDPLFHQGGLFPESNLSGDELNKLLDMTGVVSGSGDLTARLSSLDMRPTAVDEWTIVPEQCGIEILDLDTHDQVDFHQLDVYPHPPTDVSQSDDSTFDLQINPSTRENEAPQQPLGAVDEMNFTMVPDKCPIEGGSKFVVRSDKPVPDGTYDVKIGEYGSCEASGSGIEYLAGLKKIPKAKRRGTHSVEVQILDKATGILIGNTELEYVDNKATEVLHKVRKVQVRNPSLSKNGSNPHDECRRPTKKPSSDSMDGAGSNKRFKNRPIDMPLLVYLCDEMAKSGDKHFFSALIKFGIMGKVLENRCEYFKDFAITAQEHDHIELAKTIETSSGDVSDQLTETLTFGMLLDAIQTERSLENSDSGYSSDSDDDPNSCSSGCNRDCDSEDDQLSTKENNTDVVHGDGSSECDDDSSGVTYTQENSAGQNAPSSQAQGHSDESIITAIHSNGWEISDVRDLFRNCIPEEL